MSSQRKPCCIYLGSLVPSALHLQLKCFDYPELVIQFSSLCHVLNEDFYSFCYFITALDGTGERRGNASRVISHRAVTTNPGQCSTKRPVHANSDVGLVLAWASSDETAVSGKGAK